jgi:bis(5'-nucleosyl)-tetraphosphatase (symmetrical)
MATYAIGDVQGCFLTLQRLLDAIRFDPASDRLWLAGDLVNRGPRSLEVLRWARGLGEALVAVLGNHDLHLIGRSFGVRGVKRGDSLDAVLVAPDRDALIGWLRGLPLLHREGDRVLVHAGLQPAWTPAEAEEVARAVESALRGPDAGALIESLSERTLPGWGPGLDPRRRRDLGLQTLVLMRTCRRDGRLCRDFSGPPEQAPPGCRPWFEREGRRPAGVTVVCGHWARLGLRIQPGLLALDTGCAWGGRLTAVRLEDGAIRQVDFAD